MKYLPKIILLGAIAFLALALLEPNQSAASRPWTLGNPCETDPNNIFNNGAFEGGYNTDYGLVSTGWTPFVFSGAAPTFNVVGNEHIHPPSQQIFRVGTFDAGIYQTLHNLTPGTNYWYRIGDALARKGINNDVVQTIGRQVGVDPTGGTDVHSSSIQWGLVFWDGGPALNIPALTMVFTAQSANASIYFRAIAIDGTGGENRVWFDAACGEPRPDLPASTPIPGTPPPSGTRVFLPLIVNSSCTPSVLTTINVGAHPKGIATDAATNRVYTALFDSSSAVFIDAIANSSLGTFSLNDSGHGNGIGVANGSVFASMRDSTSVSILNAATGVFLANRTVGALPYGVGAANTRAWVANFGSDSVSLFDTATNNVIATTNTGSGSNPALVAASSNRAYVSLYGSGAAEIASDGTLTHFYPLGAESFGVAFNASTSRLYVSNRSTKAISTIDPTTGQILKSATLTQVPYALAINPTTNRLFVVLAEANQVDVRDGNTLASIVLLSVGAQGGDGGDGIGVMNGRIYVANNSGGTVTVIKDTCP